jgi:hypothetical protein
MPQRIPDRPLAKKILFAQLAEPCLEAVAPKLVIADPGPLLAQLL